VTGQTQAARKLLDSLAEVTDVYSFNLLPDWKPSRWRRGIGKAVRSVLALFWLVAIRFRSAEMSLFMMPSSGPGRWLEAVIGLWARCLGYRVYLRYPVYSYVNRRDLRIRLLVAAAGRKGGHFVLCPAMRRDFRATYPSAGPCHELSNGYRMRCQSPPGHDRPAGPLRIGHISNLTVEKGFDEVLDTYGRLREEGTPAELHIAGPFHSSTERAMIERARQRHDGIRYRGAVYGKEKWEFFGGLDVMLFPTRYEHEGQPNVVVESLVAGVPVLSYARACVPGLLGDLGGLAFEPGEDFVANAAGVLKGWAEQPDVLRGARDRAARQGRIVRRRARKDLERFVRILTLSPIEKRRSRNKHDG
jgi:glycosyltransferase involved in cell wall biosynthesis